MRVVLSNIAYNHEIKLNFPNEETSYALGRSSLCQKEKALTQVSRNSIQLFCCDQSIRFSSTGRNVVFIEKNGRLRYVKNSKDMVVVLHDKDIIHFVKNEIKYKVSIESNDIEKAKARCKGKEMDKSIVGNGKSSLSQKATLRPEIHNQKNNTELIDLISPEKTIHRNNSVNSATTTVLLTNQSKFLERKPDKQQKLDQEEFVMELSGDEDESQGSMYKSNAIATHSTSNNIDKVNQTSNLNDDSHVDSVDQNQVQSKSQAGSNSVDFAWQECSTDKKAYKFIDQLQRENSISNNKDKEETVSHSTDTTISPTTTISLGNSMKSNIVMDNSKIILSRKRKRKESFGTSQPPSPSHIGTSSSPLRKRTSNYKKEKEDMDDLFDNQFCVKPSSSLSPIQKPKPSKLCSPLSPLAKCYGKNEEISTSMQPNNKNVFIAQLGNITEKQIQIWSKNKRLKKQYVLHNRISEVDECGAMIVDSSVPLAKLLEHVKLEHLPNVPIFSQSWVTSQIQGRQPPESCRWIPAPELIPTSNTPESLETTDVSKNPWETEKMKKPWWTKSRKWKERTEGKITTEKNNNSRWLKKGDLACQQKPSNVSHENLNKVLTDALGQLAKVYKTEGGTSVFRANVTKKLITILKGLDFKVENADQLTGIKGIGDSMKEKVNEILATGHLTRAENLDADTKAKMAFQEIWGVSLKTAEDLIQKGYRSIEDLRARGQHELNHQQKHGLLYYEELQERMPRSEVVEIENIVRGGVKEVLPGVTSVTCGSYRRGLPTCGDVDILLSHKDGSCPEIIELIEYLDNIGFLVAHLTLPKPHRPALRKNPTYMGICKVGPDRKARRIDIKSYPLVELPFAVMYFTGNDHFNRSMRYYAKKKLSLSLSDHGITKGQWDDEGNNVIKDHQVPSLLHPKNEKEIFDFLGLEYRAPHERDPNAVNRISHLKIDPFKVKIN